MRERSEPRLSPRGGLGWVDQCSEASGGVQRLQSAPDLRLLHPAKPAAAEDLAHQLALPARDDGAVAFAQQRGNPVLRSRRAKDSMANPYRGLPSVDELARHPTLDAVRNQLPAHRLTAHSRAILERARQALSGAAGNGDGDAPQPPSLDALATAVVASLKAAATPSLRPVINATGVILHTNLGRAPLSAAALAAIGAVGQGYSNLEFDLAAGGRGSRLTHLERMLREAIGAEAGLAVNNNAAALLLTLSALTRDREVIISRGQAVEIGGGFRIPDVCRQSGALLVEVGTTNRTRLSDYRAAVTPATAAILRVHASNFKIIGFTEQPSLPELQAVAAETGVLLLDDLGSGCLLDTRRYGLAPEPTPQASLAAGADLVLFSGDKLLGGPQAGIIGGRADLVAQLRRHPLARALRTDKATIAALAATLQHYISGDAETAIPIWRMISAPAERMRERAEHWRRAIGAGAVEAAESVIGGGSLPGERLPTFVLTLRGDAPSAQRLAERLRGGDPSVVARVEKDALLLDPRTVADNETDALLAAVRAALRSA